MRFAVALFLILPCFTELRAQDYIITLRGDTVRGTVEIHSFPKVERVSVAIDKKKTEYPATTVKLVYMDSLAYVPVRTTEAYLFMRLARAGLVSLCYSRQSPGTPYNAPYLVKRSGESMEVSALRFKKSVVHFLSECNSIQQKIEEGQLGRNDLDKIVDEYSRCLVQQTQQAFVSTTDPRLNAISTFRDTLSKDTAVSPDAQEILRDIYLKVKDGKSVPNYLFEGLRETLKGHDAYAAELDKLIALLK